jgi:hypothetical protein
MNRASPSSLAYRRGTARALAVVVAGVSSPAAAFVCTRTPDFGPSVAWPRRDITLHRAGDGAEVDVDDFDEVIADAAAAWTGVTCSDLVVEAGRPTSRRLVGFDWHRGSDDPANENLVVFRNDAPADPLDAWVHTLGALAITTVTFDSSTGVLVDADIEVNDTAFEFTTCNPEDADCVVEFDLLNTLTHEVGHVVGLDHPLPQEPGASEATMFASAPRADTAKRTLATDDEDGLCTIYPDDAVVPGECYGVRRTPSTVEFRQTSCREVPAGGLAALLALLARRRRNRVHIRETNGTNAGRID